MRAPTQPPINSLHPADAFQDEFCPKLDEVLIRAVADDYDLSNQFEAVRAILKDLEDAEVEGAPHFNTGRVDGDTDRDDGR